MSRADHLGAYAGGWTNGDPAAILAATADGYVFDDPNAGAIAKGDFAAYFAELKETLDTNDDGGVLTAWCWWSFPGTDIQGSGLLKVSDDGVVSERLTYYTALPG
jgi:hypothetical protein